jgi:type II secretory pathway pseudopilin PulG
MRSSYRSARGVSLIEATVMLAVVSILTAMLAPSVRAYVQNAQQVAAKKDVEAIGGALAAMLVDVGELWVTRDGNGTAATDSPSHDTVTVNNRVDMLVTAGKVPAKQTARSGGGTTDWDTAVGTTAVQLLDYYLVTNTPSNTSSNAYRAATNMSVTTNYDPDGGGTYNAEYGWRGAYLPGPIAADPWGYRYAVNVEYLARGLSSGTPPPAMGNVNDVIVISGGNNGLVEVRYDTDGPTSGNDVFYVVAGGTR